MISLIISHVFCWLLGNYSVPDGARHKIKIEVSKSSTLFLLESVWEFCMFWGCQIQKYSVATVYTAATIVSTKYTVWPQTILCGHRP